jgi:hypothetical protein
MKTLISIFCDSTRPLKLIMMVSYLITAIALYMRADDASGDARYIFEVMDVWYWEAICLYIATARYVGLFWWKGHPLTRRTTPILGIILWSFLFTSAVTATQFGFGLLYLVCAFIEVWILARAFAEKQLGID